MYIEYEGNFYKASGGGKEFPSLTGNKKIRIYTISVKGKKHKVTVPLPNYLKGTYKIYDTNIKPTSRSGKGSPKQSSLRRRRSPRRRSPKKSSRRRRRTPKRRTPKRRTPKKSSHRRRRVSNKKSLSQRRKDCKAQGKVYNLQTGRCRKSIVKSKRRSPKKSSRRRRRSARRRSTKKSSRRRRRSSTYKERKQNNTTGNKGKKAKYELGETHIYKLGNYKYFFTTIKKPFNSEWSYIEDQFNEDFEKSGEPEAKYPKSLEPELKEFTSRYFKAVKEIIKDSEFKKNPDQTMREYGGKGISFRCKTTMSSKRQPVCYLVFSDAFIKKHLNISTSKMELEFIKSFYQSALTNFVTAFGIFSNNFKNVKKGLNMAYKETERNYFPK